MDQAIAGHRVKREVPDRRRSLRNASGNLLDIHRDQESAWREDNRRVSNGDQTRNAVALAPNGRIVVAGQKTGGDDFAVARLRG